MLMDNKVIKYNNVILVLLFHT